MGFPGGGELGHVSWLQPLKGPYYSFLFFKIYFWPRWVFVAARGLSLAVSSGGYSSLR